MIKESNNKLKKKVAWLNNLTNRWNIAKKIVYGYSIAIGISFTGTIIGLGIAYNSEVYAYKQLNLYHKQQSLLKNLETSVSRIRLHPQRLASVLSNSIWFEFEKNLFTNQTLEVNQKLDNIELFIKTYHQELEIDNRQFNSLLENYRVTTKLYSQTVSVFWNQVESNNLLGEQVNSRDTDLIILIKQIERVNINVKFDQLSDELIQIISHADIQEQEANNRFEKAQKLRIQVILISMLLSVAIAAALALYTTRLIAHPLELVTKVAIRITQESNFQLRANINSNDEVGTLATSLNQLVEWVGDYTQKLELARQTLEQRVEERTQELELARQTLEQRVEERTQELQKILQDLKETQGQLIQTEKMSSLGEMVAGIAHEVNNPINFINGNIECANDYIKDILYLISLYQQEYPQPNALIAQTIADIDLNFMTQDLSNLLISMKIGAQRIREIVLSLRNFSRLDEATVKEVNIHEGIDNTLLILNHRIKQEITVVKNYGNLSFIECYPAQLNQVFMNIVSNAIDVLLEDKNKPDKQINIETYMLDDSNITVVIKDNGSGISPEIINKLFNPFFTTKPVGKGTGLGLSICYQIIEQHKGKITVKSELGKGTEFMINLPIKTN
ncbi:ATP-binding protein [Nodularia harveyana UHCC-0300]|uniref:histidine kinase n=1 Tax=Nodularia harveyana UHCC-0300 TaxID=2974287 RepID=A0ABU5UD20_9CYAN|nr:ATP-binding protein [Nodularia harveyana]MEA5581412.1 ATP-binding protein [Nodularia harveyana UHCC-0300]